MDSTSLTLPELDSEPSFLCQDCEPILLRAHKPNFGTLNDSAAHGCGLCILFRNRVIKTLENKDYDVDEAIRQNLSRGANALPCNMSMYGVHTDPPRFRGLIDELKYNPNIFSDDISGSRFDVRFSLLAGRNSFIGGRVVPKDIDLDKCQAWIEDCQVAHESCRKTGIDDQELPTRVIDVGSLDESEEPKLIIPGTEQGKYVALSHRWGTPPPPRTTTTNLEQHLQGLAMSMLPQAFKDAIVITRKLGYRYLWIDSLCIVQNNASDWNHECPRMQSVYGNAAVTICGLGCRNSSDGLLTTREPGAVRETLRVRSNSGSVDCLLELTGQCIRTFNTGTDNSGLFERAWVLQERLLSPRVLYFGTKQMYLECNSSCVCESFVGTNQPLAVVGGGVRKDIVELPDSQLRQNWQQLVQDYSNRFLTYGDDRLPGLAGLAGHMQQRLQDDYYAGLWKRDFIHGLQWKDHRAK